uniref:Uncharacterized protein n=1 Tax=Anopheles coluzzii TaxID=1518534 RepID=A0A8W7PET1_ANOCL
LSNYLTRCLFTIFLRQKSCSGCVAFVLPGSPAHPRHTHQPSRQDAYGQRIAAYTQTTERSGRPVSGGAAAEAEKPCERQNGQNERCRLPAGDGGDVFLPKDERLQREPVREGGGQLPAVLQSVPRQENGQKGNVQQGCAGGGEGPQLQAAKQGAEKVSHIGTELASWWSGVLVDRGAFVGCSGSSVLSIR